MDKRLTEKQRRIFDFMSASIENQGGCPSLREIGERFRVSVGTAHEQAEALVAKGLLKRRHKGSARAYQLARETGLPVLGRVGAGGGVIAQEDLERHFTFRDISAGTNYMLRVRGDSMDRAGIFDGDLVRVREQGHANDGDVVVALVGDESVVKWLRKRPAGTTLESANPKYRPISEEFRVIGAVVGLVRENVRGGERA